MNPHAQSKDPYTLIRTPYAPVSIPASSVQSREGHEFHSCRISAPLRTAAQQLGWAAFFCSFFLVIIVLEFRLWPENGGRSYSQQR